MATAVMAIARAAGQLLAPAAADDMPDNAVSME